MKLIELVIKENYRNIRQEGLQTLKEVIIRKDCPSFYGHENKYERHTFCRKQDCKKCWEREVEEF